MILTELDFSKQYQKEDILGGITIFISDGEGEKEYPTNIKEDDYKEAESNLIKYLEANKEIEIDKYKKVFVKKENDLGWLFIIMYLIKV